MISYISRNIIRYMHSTSYISYQPGNPNLMTLAQRQVICSEGELLMKVRAIGLNRAQCLQRQGKYPGNTENPQEKYLGLEASGEVFDPNTNQKLYDGIALLSGGSYSQWVNIPKTHIMPLPNNLSFVKGAAIPEAWITAFQLLRYASLSQNESVVIYAGASGVGTAAIQICSILKINAFAVCSTAQKGKICSELGAKTVYYKENENWVNELITLNNGNTFKAVLDCVGSDNVDHTLKLLSIDGKWILYGLLSGGKTNLNLASILAKRINIISTTLKTRSYQYKNTLIEDFKKVVLQQFNTGKIKPIIYKVLQTQWQNPQAFIEGHTIMETNQNSGKIIIEYI